MVDTGHIARVLILLFVGGRGLAERPASQTQPAVSSDGSVRLATGGQLHYRMMGSRPDTVVIPGEAYLAEALAPLADEYTVIFYDPLGRGRSDPAPDSTHISMERLIHDLEEVRNHFKLSRMSLVGWSILGAVVANDAAAYPASVNRLVLLGAVSPTQELAASYNPPDRAARVDSAAEAELARLRSAGRDRSDPVIYCEQFWKANVAQYVGEPASASRFGVEFCTLPNEYPPAFLKWYQHLNRSMGAWDYTDAARRVSAPTLIIHGERDLVASPEGARLWATVIPDARLLLLPKVGHLYHVEGLTDLLRTLGVFLRGGWPTKAEQVGPPAQ